MKSKPLSSYPFICFDFDGVIKDSVSVKGDIFVELFRSFPLSLRDRVYAHHLANGGVNRKSKITQYLQWAYPDTPIADLPINSFLDQFSSLSIDKVVNAPWIIPMPNLLFDLTKTSTLFISSATPHREINKIVNLLNIASCFEGVWGHPNSKTSVLCFIKDSYSCTSSSLIMVGDSHTDRQAAASADTFFSLKHLLMILFKSYECH